LQSLEWARLRPRRSSASRARAAPVPRTRRASAAGTSGRTDPRRAASASSVPRLARRRGCDRSLIPAYHLRCWILLLCLHNARYPVSAPSARRNQTKPRLVLAGLACCVRMGSLMETTTAHHRWKTLLAFTMIHFVWASTFLAIL